LLILKKIAYLILILLFSKAGFGQKIFKKSLLLMGSNFEIVLVAKTQAEADI